MKQKTISGGGGVSPVPPLATLLGVYIYIYLVLKWFATKITIGNTKKRFNK